MKIMLSAVLLFFMTILPVVAGNVEEGQEIFKARCDICHQLPDPDMLNLEQWKSVLDSMQNLMKKSGMPPLTEEEYRNLFEYLRNHTKK